MNLESVIGLEIHVQLKTESKMFCSCANIVTGDESFDPAQDKPFDSARGKPFDETQGKPNTAICPICLGYPGTLPVPNLTAISWTQRAGAALNCELAEHSKFDRKHYFYPDLPKGYQISQYDQPFCGEGGLEIVVDGDNRAIGIERIHLEEDAAKNTHPSTGSGQARADYTLVDYNRAGTPLMEIVTKPDLRSPAEAKLFLQELQKIMRALGVSDADMEKGQMRCDANISLREVDSDELHPKTEIKNLNSFRFVAKALQYEIKRQTKLWESGKPPTELATRGFDSGKGVTVEQRTKEEAADYRYFPEPDIPPFAFSAKDLAAVRAGLPELPMAKRARLMRQTQVNEEQARLLAEDDDLASFFENTVSELEQLDNEEVAISPKEVKGLVKLAGKIILRQLRDLMSDQGLAGDDLKVSAANFAELIVAIDRGRITVKVIPEVLAEMQRTGGDPDHVIQNLGVEQVSDSGDLDQYIEAAIADNPDVVEKIKAGKESAIQFLMGQVMAKSKGTANPAEVTKLLKEKLL